MRDLRSEKDQCTSNFIENILSESLEVATTFPIVQCVEIRRAQPSKRRSSNDESKEVENTGTRRHETLRVIAGCTKWQLGCEMSR